MYIYIYIYIHIILYLYIYTYVYVYTYGLGARSGRRSSRSWARTPMKAGGARLYSWGITILRIIITIIVMIIIIITITIIINIIIIIMIVIVVLSLLPSCYWGRRGARSCASQGFIPCTASFQGFTPYTGESLIRGNPLQGGKTPHRARCPSSAFGPLRLTQKARRHRARGLRPIPLLTLWVSEGLTQAQCYF